MRLPGFVKRLATGRNSARRTARPVRNIPRHYSRRSQAVMQQAEELARAAQSPQLSPAHLLLALSRDQDSLPAQLLTRYGFDSRRLNMSGGKQVASEYNALLELTAQTALKMNHPYIGTEHLLLALLESEAGQTLLSEAGVDQVGLRQELVATLQKPQYQPFAY